jgi:hypothetical protein
MAYELLTVKLGLSLSFFWVCSHLTNIQNFWLLCLYWCDSWNVQNGLWAVLMVKSQAVGILCYITCEVGPSVWNKSLV